MINDNIKYGNKENDVHATSESSNTREPSLKNHSIKIFKSMGILCNEKYDIRILNKEITIKVSGRSASRMGQKSQEHYFDS